MITALTFLLSFAVGNQVAQTNIPTADSGAEVSIQIPILFDDRHIYAKPAILKRGRVLAGIARSRTLLIPLRSMFEQMGATVSWDSRTQTATVAKPGAEVKVAVGKPEVVINGESRPLDEPPMEYQGIVLVPIRVISEGMGAYVQWVPDRHIVVVRYIPATPPPSPAPPPPPPPPPPPAPTPSPRHPGAIEDSTLQLYDAAHPEWGLRGGTYFGRYSYVLLFREAGARNDAILASLFQRYSGQGESVVLGRPTDISDTIHYNVFELPVRASAYSPIDRQASIDQRVRDVESEYDWNEALTIRRNYCHVPQHTVSGNPICSQPVDTGPVILTFFAPIPGLRQEWPAFAYDFSIVIPDANFFGSVIQTIQLRIDDPSAVSSDRAQSPSAQVRLAFALDLIGSALAHGRTGVKYWSDSVKATP